jgi:hypothetical protein
MRVISPAPRDAWLELVEASDQAQIFQTPGWLDCICAAGEYEDASRLYDLPGGRRFVLPMVRRRGRLESLPHGWGSGGLVGNCRVEADDVATVLDDLTGHRRALVRPNFHTATAWAGALPTAAPHVVHVIDLRDGYERLQAERFSNLTRRGLRQARKRADEAGLVVETGSSPELVGALYDLYRIWTADRAARRHVPRVVAEKLAERREPRAKFELVASRLGEGARIQVARVDGRPVAATFELIQGVNAVQWRNYSDRSIAGPLRAAELLYALAIEHACEAGCHFFELGESGGVESLMAYKERFGAVGFPFAEYQLRGRVRLPSAAPAPLPARVRPRFGPVASGTSS